MGLGLGNHLSCGISHVQLVNHLSSWSYVLAARFDCCWWNHPESESIAIAQSFVIGPKPTAFQGWSKKLAQTWRHVGAFPRNQVPHFRVII